MAKSFDVRTNRRFYEAVMLDDSRFLDEVVEVIADDLEPDDVFDDDKLAEWAESNGYVHKDMIES